MNNWYLYVEEKEKVKRKGVGRLHYIPLHILVYLCRVFSSGYFCYRWDRFAPTWKDMRLLYYYMKKSKQFKNIYFRFMI